MDSFRKPEMIIAIIAVIGLIVVAIYFYRKFTVQQEEINKYGERFAGVVKKIGEMPQQTHLAQMVENFKMQDSVIMKQAQTITALTSEVEELRYLVDIMSEHLDDMGYKVRLPRRGATLKSRKATPISKRVGFRGRDNEESDNDDNGEEEEEEEEPPARGKGKKASASKDDEEDDEIARKIALARANRGK